MENTIFMLLVVFLALIVQYLLEVYAGSAIGIYAPESGHSSAECAPRKSTSSQFLGEMAPLQLLVLGLPLLTYDRRGGAILILTSAVLALIFAKFGRPRLPFLASHYKELPHG